MRPRSSRRTLDKPKLAGTTCALWHRLLLFSTLPSAIAAHSIHASASAAAPAAEPSPKSTVESHSRHAYTTSFADGINASCPIRPLAEIGQDYIRYPICYQQPQWERVYPTHSNPSSDQVAGSATSADPTATATATAVVSVSDHLEQQRQQLQHEQDDADSALDNSNFLSFEEWRKQNLAKIGQSVDQVPGSAAGKKDHRPAQGGNRAAGIRDNLDSFGEEGELDFEFGAFASDDAPPSAWEQRREGAGAAGNAVRRDGLDAQQANKDGTAVEDASQAGLSRRKNAGVTCKERSNYASFDCAATVLKTNPECSGASAVLIENKDTYMLNKCSAKDKFVILELCDDILIDTIVLANYEFFSSRFRTFRVSVSDRYPPKSGEWKELGTFEALNTRDTQAFPVENPLIWARYVKIEFLTHYGNEFYCPLSLIRVHGTTMMEEFKSEGDNAKADDTAESEVVTTPELKGEGIVVAQVHANVSSVASTPGEAPGTTVTVEEIEIVLPKSADHLQPNASSVELDDICATAASEVEKILLNFGAARVSDICGVDDVPPASTQTEKEPQHVPGDAQSHSVASTKAATSAASVQEAIKGSATVTPTTPSSTIHQGSGSQAAQSNVIKSTTVRAEDAVPTPETMTKTTKTSTVQAQPHTASPAAPPPPNPTTQESFYKSINKRLQMLETNSTLSLLYIEEQSRILRDAFNKVEKRQLGKTTEFLENLNKTVLSELHGFRQQYDQAWHSVIIEFEQQRLQYNREVFAVTRQLGVLADELLFQKRLSLIQSIFVLILFGVVLFSRDTVRRYLELPPRVQGMLARGGSPFLGGSFQRTPFFSHSRSPSRSPVSLPTSPVSEGFEENDHAESSTHAGGIPNSNRHMREDSKASSDGLGIQSQEVDATYPAPASSASSSSSSPQSQPSQSIQFASDQEDGREDGSMNESFTLTEGHGNVQRLPPYAEETGSSLPPEYKQGDQLPVTTQ